MATLQALPSQGFDLGNPPEDIPLLEEDQINNLFANQSLVTYLTNEEFRTVTSFYHEAMPAEGWSLTESGNLEVDNLAILNFEKDGRKATLTVVKNVLGEQTSVTILINDNP